MCFGVDVVFFFPSSVLFDYEEFCADDGFAFD